MAESNPELFDEIHKYLLKNGGAVRSSDLVKHCKKILTDPETRDEARKSFKEYVNTLCTIKNIEHEKYLTLKEQYRDGLGPPSSSSSSSIGSSSQGVTSPTRSTPPTPVSPLREPPPYRSPPPAALSPSSFNEPIPSTITPTRSLDTPKTPDDVIPGNSDNASPPVPPRRKSQDKLRLENKENISVSDRSKQDPIEASIKEDDDSATLAAVSAEQLSVREKMQRFNRMASQTDVHGRTNGSTTPTKKRSDKGADEDDSASVASQLDGKSREWLVRASDGDYQALAKLAAEEPRLARLRDPSSTALHWGAKHGNEDIIKLIAGTYKEYIKGVNETTNGGYTPLHIAMQFNHENIFNLLVQVYGANQEVRDYSGKKARQYLVSQEAAVSQDTFRKIKARKKHAEKDLGFLRIGSLNVRVKRTTEAFSQFLGVASSTTATPNEKIHKSWGSADNIQGDQKVMPPPEYAPIKKRRSRRAQDFVSSREERDGLQSNNHHAQISSSRLSQPRRSVTNIPSAANPVQNDSDSDNACGFDSGWRGSALL